MSERRSRLRPADVGSLARLGLTGRPLRALLSAVGIALGVATLVAVTGISSSSRAQLIAEIDALGTNMLTVTPGQELSGGQATLPATAPAMVARIGPVQSAPAIGDVAASVYRNDRIPAANTDAITVYSAGTNLLRTVQGHLARGTFLNRTTIRFPAAVLGASAASALGIDQAGGRAQVWLGGHWFAVAGIMAPTPLAPELDRAVLIGLPIARSLLHARAAPAHAGPLAPAAARAGGVFGRARPGQCRGGRGRPGGDRRPARAAERFDQQPGRRADGPCRRDRGLPGPLPRAGCRRPAGRCGG